MKSIAEMPTEFERRLRLNHRASEILDKKECLNLEKNQILLEVVSIKEQLLNKEHKREQLKLLTTGIYSADDYINAKKELRKIQDWQKKAGKSKLYKNVKIQEIKNELVKLNYELKPIKLKIYEELCLEEEKK